MRTKSYKIKDNLYIIELKDELITRLIVTHKDYDLSYEILSIYNEDLNNKKAFNIKDYIKTLNYDNLINYLIDVNSEEEDYLFHDEFDSNLILKEEE